MANDYLDYFTINGVEVLIQDYGRDQPNGVPVLDPQGKLPTKYLPDNYADTLLVSSEDPYGDNFVNWVSKLVSPERKNSGKAWTQGTGENTAYTMQEPAYVNELWVCTSYNHGIWWSKDGKSWTQGIGENTAYTMQYPAYANGLLVCGSNSHGVWWSGVPVYLPEMS